MPFIKFFWDLWYFFQDSLIIFFLKELKIHSTIQKFGICKCSLFLKKYIFI